MTPQFEVGDVITLGKHETVPIELVGKYFIIENLETGIIKLSYPYKDRECKNQYHRKR